MKSVVVIGGGFGGLAALKTLLHSLPGDYKAVLVSEQEYFTFKPLLHEVATGAFGTGVVCEPIPGHFRSCRNFEFVMARALKVNLRQQVVYCGNCQKMPYDFLVIATGSLTNFYNVPGTEANCLKLESVDDALAIRQRVVKLFSSSQKRHLTFVVVGAGPTGVEFSAELSEFAIQLSRQFNRNFSIIVVDRSPLVLPGASSEFRSKVMRIIWREKIQLLAGAAVTEVRKGFVSVEGSSGKKRIDCDMAVWAAGIRPSELRFVPKAGKSHGNVVVNSCLQLPIFPNVFAVGDCALAKSPDGTIVPWLAQSAVQEGRIAAANIVAAIRGKPQQKFVFRPKGLILPVGKGAALADISMLGFDFFFDGFLAWWLNRTIYLMNMLSLRHKLKVAWLWTLGLFKGRELG